MNIILAGIMGRHPFGGVAWCSLMYLLGLRRLGHQVWYLEDTGECCFDPAANRITTSPQPAVHFIRGVLEPYGFGERWCYVDFRENYHGHSRTDWRAVCAGADLILNLSNGFHCWRDEYAAIPHSAFIDSDPAFTQLDISARPEKRLDFFAGFDALFTFGRNIGTPRCPVPTAPFGWKHTWQPICIEEWHPTMQPPRSCFTTVMTWRIDSFKDIGGNKDREFLKVLDLPSRTVVPLELAVTGPIDLLRRRGWHCRPPYEISRSLDAYRDYIRGSMGEFAVAKSTYVQTRSGWFSDRTACYLGSGRPAVVQDTGFSAHLPNGEGLIAFRRIEEAKAGLEAVVADYARHSRAARDLAVAHFSPSVVLPPLLERATGGAVIMTMPEQEARSRAGEHGGGEDERG
jgi:hypothetical protein